RSRGRSHEHSLHGWQDRGTSRSLGPRPDVFDSRVQPSRTPSAALEQSGFIGSGKNLARETSDEELVGTRCQSSGVSRYDPLTAETRNLKPGTRDKTLDP